MAHDQRHAGPQPGRPSHRRTAAPRPTWAEEDALWRRGHRLVAGVDEVGRGPLAGPVVAAAVVLPPSLLPRRTPPSWLHQVRDSKLVPPKLREKLAPLLRECALAVGVGSASHAEIDRVGILPATRMAMRRAIEQIAPPPDFVLIDAVTLPDSDIPHKAIIHGDAICFSIAAASIVAKVFRDQLMVRLDTQYPGYGFAAHKGYPTPSHLASLQRLGPSPVHRRCYAPVRRLLEGA